MSEEVHAKMAALMRTYPIIESKSRLIEKAVEYFIEQVTLRGLDWNWRPKPVSPLRQSRTLTMLQEFSAGTVTILLVDDEELVRRFACEVLTASGYQVLEAANGHEALGVIQSHAGPIHLLLTDVVMPGINGVQLAERMEVLRPETKVQFMSGSSSGGNLHLVIHERGAPFLHKPLRKETLERAVHEVLTS